MKLAEALIQRADIKKYLAQLKARLNVNAKHQEGVKPAESPTFLLEELTSSVNALETLIFHINKTNVQTMIDGRSLAELLAERDAKTLEVSIIRDFLGQASDLQERYSHSEILVQSSVDVAALRRKIDEKSKNIRQLDLRIQELNWTTELV